jgi:hypothetical protein
MEFQFRHHYHRDEARALIPKIRQWLDLLIHHRARLRQSDLQLEQLLSEGRDVGGLPVHDWIQSLTEVKRLLREFQSRDIQIKDVERGLIDFPSIVGGKEVFLCWEKDEEDVEYWHDLDTGFAGREPI